MVDAITSIHVVKISIVVDMGHISSLEMYICTQISVGLILWIPHTIPIDFDLVQIINTIITSIVASIFVVHSIHHILYLNIVILILLFFLLLHLTVYLVRIYLHFLQIAHLFNFFLVDLF